MQLPSRATSRRRRRCRISKSTQAEYADVAPRPAEAGYDCATRIEKKMQEGGKGDEGARDPGLKGTGTPGPSWRFCTTKNKSMEIGVPGSHDEVEQPKNPGGDKTSTQDNHGRPAEGRPPASPHVHVVRPPASPHRRSGFVQCINVQDATTLVRMFYHGAVALCTGCSTRVRGAGGRRWTCARGRHKDERPRSARSLLGEREISNYHVNIRLLEG